MCEIKGPNAGKYKSTAFRRWASQERKDTGPHRSAVATVRNWGSLAPNGYVDLIDGLSRGVAKLFIGRCDFESDGACHLHWVSRIRERSISPTSSGGRGGGWIGGEIPRSYSEIWYSRRNFRSELHQITDVGDLLVSAPLRPVELERSNCIRDRANERRSRLSEAFVIIDLE